VSKYIKYDAFDRYMRRKEFTNKRAALKHAKAEARDGWPSDVTDLRTGKTIWKSSGGAL